MKGKRNSRKLLEKRPIVEVDFAELADGSFVEMIQDPADATKTLLAVYDNGAVRYAESVDDGGRTLVPLSRADENLRYVRLAEGAKHYAGILDLTADVGCLSGLCLDLDQDYLALLAAFAISTSLPEKSSVAPYLALVGPPGSGKTTAMRVLSLLCYRGLLTGDITAPAFYDICHRLRPTVLLDETLTTGHSRELVHLLKVSSTQGFASLRKGQARLAYGPKVFSWLELPNDAALNSRCLIVPMHRTSRTDLMSPSDPRVLEYAKMIQMQLLQFRFEHFRDIAVPKIPANVELSARPLDLYRALALPFNQDQNMCNFLGSMIAEQGQRQSRVLSPAQASTIRVLDAFIHGWLNPPFFMMTALTRAVNSDLASRGEPNRWNERKLGDILTSLSFTNRTRKNTGYVLWLNRSDRARIHEAARDYGVEGTRDYPIENCEICTQASAAVATSAAPAEVPTQKVELEDTNSEGRERRERRSSGMRSRARVSSLGVPHG